MPSLAELVKTGWDHQLFNWVSVSVWLMTLWMFRGLQLSYTCKECWLCHLFPITFPTLPTPQTTPLILLSHKYPNWSVFRSGLEIHCPVYPVSYLANKTFFFFLMQTLLFWLAVHWAKWTWLGNKSWEIGWFQVWATEYVRWSQNNLFCRKQVSTQRGVGSCLKDSWTTWRASTDQSWDNLRVKKNNCKWLKHINM